MSDTGRLNPRTIKPGVLKVKFIVLGAVVGDRMPEDGNASDPNTWRRIEGGQEDQGLTLNSRTGSYCQVNSNGEIELTGVGTSRAGSAFFNRISVSSDFTITFDQYQFGGNGADGIVFGLHNDPRGKSALGYLGGGMGWFNVGSQLGIAPSVFCEFDNYYGNSGTSLSDAAHGITNNHMHLGQYPIRLSNATELDSAVDLGSASYLEDGTWHDTTVTYVAATNTLTVSLDSGAFTTSGVIDLESFFSDQYAYWGFSSGTGGLTHDHKIRNIVISATPENPSVLRCTEDQ